jgi:hypothetical protein
MKLDQFRDFTGRMTKNLEKEADVQGFVAVGSMSEIDRLPDEWSDHDFFVIVNDGCQERFRKNFEWLPDSDNIVFSFQETEHGVKIIYNNGHMLEFAIFSPDELYLAKINNYKLIIDRSDIKSRLDRVTYETAKWSEGNISGTHYLTGQFLTNLMVGVGRHYRGEKISGFEFAKVHGLNQFVNLVIKHIPPEDSNAVDNINPLRRFEQAYPALGEKLNLLLDMETPRYVSGMLDLFEENFRGIMDNYPHQLVETIRQMTERKNI